MQEELNRNKGKWSAETVRNHKSKLETLKKFRSSINMHKIDFNFLEEYQAFLEDGRSYNTAHSHLRFFRMMINRAIKQGLTDNYPFRNFKMPEPESRDKDFLDREERSKLFELLDGGDLPSYLHKTLHVFLLACYTGVRNGDGHQFLLKEVEGDMLIIRQSKKKGGIVRIPLTSVSKKLLETLPAFYKPRKYKYKIES
jgi:integrase